MAHFKKFMFDNFVIETKPEADLPEDSNIYEQEENKEEVAEKTEAFNEEEVTEVIPEPEPEPEPELEPEPEPEPEPEEPSYSQEELDEKVDAARNEGYEQGFRNSQQGIDSEVTSLLMDILQKLQALLDSRDAIQKELENQSIEVMRTIVKKLVPTLQAEQAADLVSKFIADNFNNFKNEAKLSFYIHPDIISYAQEKIASLAKSYDFEGKIALHKDSLLAKSDCRIEWEKGGIELNGKQQIEKVDEFLSAEENKEPEIKHDR